MSMKKAITATMSLLALAACAADQGDGPATHSAAAPAAPAAPMMGAQVPAPGGTWTVVNDYAAQSVGMTASPYMGQTITLETDRAVDVSGRLCKTPSYMMGEGAPVAVLGNPAQPQAATGTAPLPVLTVMCDGQLFASYVALGEKEGILTRSGPWVLKLDRKAEVKAAEPAKEEHAQAEAKGPEAKKPEEKKADAQKTEGGKPDPRTLVYLASYKDEKTARSGFGKLAKVSPLLAGQQPIVQTVNLGKKGTWVRLYGMAQTEDDRKKICSQVGKRVDECGARNRE